tara:strand:- start:1006 stop:1443 length:438 start_codon:yes stop_codon:yes gene_type:complete
MPNRLYKNPTTAKMMAPTPKATPVVVKEEPPVLEQEVDVFDPEAGKVTEDPFPDNITDYESMTYNDLRSLCKERGLDATGTKVELIARLQADDAPSEEIPISEEAATEASDAPSEEAVSNEEEEPEGEVSESENSGEEQPIGEEE